MNPFIPCKKVRAILVSYKFIDRFAFIKDKMNIDVLGSIPNHNLPGNIDDHPDMSLHPLDYNNFIVDKDLYYDYKDLLSKYGINVIPSYSSLSSKYPYDSLLNIGRISKFYIHNDIIDMRLGQYFQANDIKHIFVKQGYSKCSILNINCDTIITQDMGIHKKLTSMNYNSLILEQNHINIEGYDTGFIGGCGGLLDKDLILLSGDPAKYKFGNKLIDYLELMKIDYLYPRYEFQDIGSIIPIM